jgi:TetR/AcrR family transcriptional regulator, cholesterol catabolism regulator
MFSEQQHKWLKRTEELFMRYGIKSITMDDVARELGISKKTLYQFVENKDDLVMKVLERHIEEDRSLCTAMFDKAANAIEEIAFVIETNTQQLRQMKANIVYDLQKYHRDAWEMMRNYQWGFMYDVVRNNLERGIAEGLYRNDFNVDIVTKIHIVTSFQLFDESIFPQDKYPLEVIFREFLMHYLYGILSEKGLSIVKTHIS